MYVNFENFKKVRKVWVFESKKPCFWVKNFRKLRKKLGKILEKVRQVRKQGFPNVRKFLKLFFFRNFRKLRKNDVKLEPRKSQKNSFQLKNQLESSVKSSECRALTITSWMWPKNPLSKFVSRNSLFLQLKEIKSLVFAWVNIDKSWRRKILQDSEKEDSKL